MNILREKSVVKTYNKLSKLPLGSITAQGWIKEQLLRNKDGMGGHLDELEPELIGTPWITYPTMKTHPFYGDMTPDFAAGLCGELSGCYWTGLVQLAFTLQDDELIQKATDWVEGAIKKQEMDGYLGTFAPGLDRMLDYNPWSASWCYRALLSFYEATGRKDVLDAVYRGCLWFCENWKEHKTDYAGSFIIEPMIIVYGYTGDERLVKFSEDWLLWLEDNSKWPNKVSEYLSDRLPYASIHAVAYGEEVKNPAIIYCATGEERLLKASIKGMEKGLKCIIQVTGAPSSCAEQISPKGAANETEYCNFSTYSHTYSWLTLVTGDARWGDEMERCLFNGAEGARKKDERGIAYFSSPNQLFASKDSCLYGSQPDLTVYAPCYSVACCPTNSVRLIPEFVRSMGVIDEQEDLYLLCYGPAEVKAPKLDLVVDTLYPFRDTITLRVVRGQKEKLYIRVPAWCQAPCATINGKEVVVFADETGFACIEELKAGDEVVLHFPMEIKIGRVDDTDGEAKFPVCIERGPLVYALPISTSWHEYPGNPATPLPEGWSWYEGKPEPGSSFRTKNQMLTFKAIDENLASNEIKVIEHEVVGYVWENPPVSLEVPLYQAKYERMFLSTRLREPWDAVVDVEEEASLCTMVPHGCTNLRITYLPRAAKENL